MRRETCPKCSSSRIMHNVRVIDRDGEYANGSLSVQIERKPDALVFKGVKTFEVHACICGGCGYAELYVANPDELWQAYDESRPTNAKP